MVSTKSRANYRGGTWKVGNLCPDVALRNDKPKLEFYITDENGSIDRPVDGETYSCSVPGGYKLQSGKLIPFSKAMKEPVMVVCRWHEDACFLSALHFGLTH